jgi:hypothetical protein
MGSNANVFRMSISSVPWTRSLGLSGIKQSSPWLPRGEYTSHPVCQEENHDSLHFERQHSSVTVPSKKDGLLFLSARYYSEGDAVVNTVNIMIQAKLNNARSLRSDANATGVPDTRINDSFGSRI